MLELWHGPTLAFKDMALSVLPRLMTAAKKDEGTILILVATSGDTGKAALEGFRDVPGTRIAVFYPDGGVSFMQRLQMVTQEGGNTHVMAVNGNFDDTQNTVKDIFTDKDFKEIALMLENEMLEMFYLHYYDNNNIFTSIKKKITLYDIKSNFFNFF